MQELIIGIVSSLLAGGITVAAGWLGLAWPRRVLVRGLSKLTGVGVERSYAKQSAANSDLAADLRGARWIKVLTGRGNELTRDSFQLVWQAGNPVLEYVHILLPDPDDPGGWLARRVREVQRADPAFGDGLLADQLRANIRYLDAVSGRDTRIELRLFDAPHTYRVILTDRLAYFTPYQPGVHARNSPCLVFRSGSAMYDHLLRSFDIMWPQAVRSRPDERSV
ncbi:hypothetical protein ACQEUU_06020 [Nonomuraea sp. CA-218870]|uniref:hypothetical protein n=1 Tax=Nonomuraea sp. CA-218870 TaxID=3239998 RepID=UPI003D8FA4B3